MELERAQAEQRERVITTDARLPDLQVSNQYAGLKVLGLVADNSACGYYRVINPLHMLKMHGADVMYSSSHSFDSFLKYDLIIAPRQHSPEVYEMLRFAAWEDKCIIYEIDDDLDSVLPSSPAYTTYHQGSPELAMIPKFIRNSHGLTTTTTEIGRWYYQYNRNIAVIENYIDFGFRDWAVDVEWKDGNPILTPKEIERPEEWKGKIVIAFAGGTTHSEDLEVLGPQIKRVLEKHPNVVFAMYTSLEMMLEFCHKFSLSRDQVHHIPARHFMDYPKGLHGIDIGLAPIVCCQFNLAKSHLKPLEYLGAGATAICSNVGPYAKFERRHPGMILTVGQGKWSHPSWFSAIDHLVSNPDLLQKMKTEGRQLVIKDYCLEKNFHRWPMSWQAIMEKVRAGQVGPPADLHPKEWYKSYGKTGRNDPCPCGSMDHSGKVLKYKECCKESVG